jgi:prevent-host-death family protein
MESGVIEVSAAELQRNTGRYQDIALTEAVAVTRSGRESTVLISESEYQRLKQTARQVLMLEDFTAEDLAALEATHARDAAKAFDGELA